MIETTAAQDRLALKKLVRIFYDIQRLRLQAGGRVQERAPGTEIHLSEADLLLIESRKKDLEKLEKTLLKDVEHFLKTRTKFYAAVLSDKVRYRGIGVTMAGVILSEFDISREDTVSKMWAFAGLRPMPASRCAKCNHVVEEKDGAWKHVAFRPKKGATPEPEEMATKKPKKGSCPNPVTEIYASAKSQRPTSGEKLPYNAWLRTKLVGVLGGVLLKVGSPWRSYYDEYKHRKESAGWGVSDGHRHNAAIRYMVKMLLLDIWKEWRTFEGLSVREPYAAEYLGKRHGDNSAAAARAVGIEEIDPEIEAEIAQL